MTKRSYYSENGFFHCGDIIEDPANFRKVRLREPTEEEKEQILVETLKLGFQPQTLFYDEIED